MKTFEEKFTAWVDGRLLGSDLAEFEAELANVKDAELDKIAAHQLGDMLREHGKAPELRNADFFNHQIMQQIEAEMPKPGEKAERPRFSWSLLRIALAGAFSLVLAFGLFHFMIPAGPQPNTAGLPVTQIISTRSGEPTITASAFQSKPDNVTVLWLDGLKYMPNGQAKKPQPEKTQPDKSPEKAGNH